MILNFKPHFNLSTVSLYEIIDIMKVIYSKKHKVDVFSLTYEIRIDKNLKYKNNE
jgi:hypothetical protein